jgi:hypothetical protein
MSEDGSMCVNLHHNNEKFALVYTFTAMFGVIVIMVSFCYMVCNCCTFQVDYDPLDYLRYSYMMPNDELAKLGGLDSVDKPRNAVNNFPADNDFQSKKSKEIELPFHKSIIPGLN